MDYSLASTPPEDCSITIEDRNIGGSFGNHDEVACNAYSRCDLGGTIDSLSVIEPLLRIVELEERQGD